MYVFLGYLYLGLELAGLWIGVAVLSLLGGALVRGLLSDVPIWDGVCIGWCCIAAIFWGIIPSLQELYKEYKHGA